MSAIEEIATAVARATPEIRRGLGERRHKVDRRNPSGDTQVEADDWLDDLFVDALADLDTVGTIASEERAETVDVGNGLGVAIDPLDGSSNLAVNGTVGTVLGVYDAALPASGRDLVAAMSVLYGPVTTMTVAADGDAERRLLRDGEVAATEPASVPDTPAIYGVSGRTDEWSPALRGFVEDLRLETKLRYTGAMVADVEHALVQGGFAGYPATESRPDGVLRLQYEANPVAYIMESAGGGASTGSGSVLDVSPEALHQKVPAYFGTTAVLDDLEAALA